MHPLHIPEAWLEMTTNSRSQPHPSTHLFQVCTFVKLRGLLRLFLILLFPNLMSMAAYSRYIISLYIQLASVGAGQEAFCSKPDSEPIGLEWNCTEMASQPEGDEQQPSQDFLNSGLLLTSNKNERAFPISITQPRPNMKPMFGLGFPHGIWKPPPPSAC